MLTTLLTEIDGFESLTGVLILAATNRPEAIDPALIRPGRLDQVVYVGPPDQKEREAIFNVHLRRLVVASTIDAVEMAQQTDGYSGAEIKAICSEAGIIAYERYLESQEMEKLEITVADLQQAMRKIPRKITKSMIKDYETWSRKFNNM